MHNKKLCITLFASNNALYKGQISANLLVVSDHSDTYHLERKSMKGEKDLDDLLNFSDTYIDPLIKKKGKKSCKSTMRIKLEEKGKEERKKGEKEKKENFVESPFKNFKTINPLEAFYSVLKCYDRENFEQNVYFQCLSFILQSKEEQVIPAGQQKDITTNYYFGELMLKKANLKKLKKEQHLEKLSNMLRYYVTNDIVSDKHVRTIFKAGTISELLGKPMKVTIINNSVQDYLVSQGTIVAKMFIYVEENK